MYTLFALDDLMKVKTEFFANLQYLYSRAKCLSLKQFLDKEMKESNRQYFFRSGRPLFRVVDRGDQTYQIFDETNRIEVILTEDDTNKLHNFLKNSRNISNIKKQNKTVLDDLLHQMIEGPLMYIQDKPFLTYDIETTFTGNDITGQHFEMAYATESDQSKDGKLIWQYIDRVSMQRFCDYLLAYDGWIIGYNQIAFDNPVMVHNCGYGQAELDILNAKSLDPFLFFSRVLKRRIGLSKVASALISQGKDIFDSGAEGAQALVEYKKTGDKKLLSKVKKYCKHDVRITLGVWLYLMHYRTIRLDQVSRDFDIAELMQLSVRRDQQEKFSSQNTSLQQESLLE